MKETPLLDRLLKLQKENLVSFHVPGHKNGKIFNKINGKKFVEVLPNIDTTEIIGTDYLHNPKEVIKKAQDRAREVFKSDATFFLVNGSTSGIYSMIMAATSPGDKIIVARNCHQSVINATILGDLTPIYLYPEIDVYRRMALGVLPEEVKKKLLENPDAKAVVITYPTYDGFASDLKKIAQIVHKHGKVLLVDEAHGAHLGLSDKLPMTALECGADIVVQSTHKTLPAFTQSSMLHIQGDRVDIEKLRFMLKLHQSSSPSYLLMASLDLATTIYKDRGRQLMQELLEDIESFKNKVKEIPQVTLLEEVLLGKDSIKAVDITKLWISMQQNNIDGDLLEKKLRNKYNIQMELSNRYGVLGITSIANDKEDFEKLYDALSDLVKQEGEETLKKLPFFSYPLPKQIFTPKEALYRAKKQVPLEKSKGCISAEYLIPYPPGIPILVPGEVIEEEIIVHARSMVESGMEVLGLKDYQWKTIEVLV